MSLPSVAVPQYKCIIPSTGIEIEYRPFLVKEEKLLVLALESEDTKQITNAIKAVIKSCILTKGIKVENLPTFDIEYLFLNIRGKSVGEEVEVNIIAPDDETTSVPVKLMIDDIKVKETEGHTNKVKVDDELTMEMKYPSLHEFISNNFDFNDDNNIERSFDLIGSCIDKVYNEEEVWSVSDFSKKEINGFLEQMNSKQFKEIEKFFDTMPKLSHEINVLNPKTQVKSTVVLEGLSSFFA